MDSVQSRHLRTVLSPAAALRKHRVTDQPRGREYLERLAGEEERWLRAMVKHTARAYQVDPDDLFQDLAEGLIGTDALDMSRDGLRGWLRTRTRWKAKDLARQHRRQPFPTESEELARAVEAGEPPMPTVRAVPEDWDVGRLVMMGLTRDQAQIVILLCWDLGIPVREYAELMHRSYAKARKDRERGLARFHRLFDLEAHEDQAIRTWRRLGLSEAALLLSMPEAEFAAVLRGALAKIHRTFEIGKRRTHHAG